ncbi:MAG: sigma-70 family RNA polymerase sigma factor [Lewinellaceae bacterium]|nr:sigma-70 family RNA polymerase sigma factor [Phaeodactylibacter sp.]MCB9345974.1 sigma-70 family RNA polymerase sigma factor [Lewinellaceae bacterium]
MPQNFTDKELVDMLCSEDEKGQRTALLYMEKHWKPLAYDIVINQGNGRREYAEGLYDEAVSDLVLLVRNGTFIQKKSKLSTFFYGILKNKWRKFFRDVLGKQQKEKEAYGKLPNAWLVSVEEQLIERERVKATADAIAQLDKGCRQLILDFWFKEKSIREISEELAVSDSAVKKRHERCKDKLREVLRRFLD